MQITIDVPDSLLQDSVRNSLAATYLGTNYDSGQGKAVVREQVIRWARSQDYTPMIKELGPAIVREAVESELVMAVKAEVKRQLKAMKEKGELADLFSQDIAKFSGEK
jgi:hypothetical protein